MDDNKILALASAVEHCATLEDVDAMLTEFATGTASERQPVQDVIDNLLEIRSVLMQQAS
jgi:hypothetical protein